MKNKNTLVFIVLGVVAAAGLILLFIKYLDKLTDLFEEIKRSIHRFELKGSSHNKINANRPIDFAEFNEFDEETVAFDANMEAPAEE